jgi:hypothetical protein
VEIEVQKNESLRSQLMLSIPECMRNCLWMTCKRPGWDLQAHPRGVALPLELPQQLQLGCLSFSEGFLLFRYSDKSLLDQLPLQFAEKRYTDADWDALACLASKFGEPAVQCPGLGDDDRGMLLLLESSQARHSKVSLTAQESLLRLLRKRIQVEALVGETQRLTGYARLHFFARLLQAALADDFDSI